MRATVDGFSYGLVTPVAAYLMACLSGALGLRCITKSLRGARPWRAGWLALGSTALGAGIWTTHFIAMMGFTIAHTPLSYDKPTTFASLGVGIVMVGVGMFIVGYRGVNGTALFTGGTITGLGIASMHYLGMAGLQVGGRVEYNTLVVAASVLVAVVAATAALWAAMQAKGFLWSLGASIVLGLAVTGMHYAGMAAVTVRLHGARTGPVGDSPAQLLAPMLIGPLAFLLLAAVVVLVDPQMVVAKRDWGTSEGAAPVGATGSRDTDPVLPDVPRSTLSGTPLPHRATASRGGSRTPQNW